jgi:hypothetical protein
VADYGQMRDSGTGFCPDSRRIFEGHMLGRAWFESSFLGPPTAGLRVTIRGETPDSALTVSRDDAETIVWPLWADDDTPRVWDQELYGSAGTPLSRELLAQGDMRAAESHVLGMLWPWPSVVSVDRLLTALSISRPAEATLLDIEISNYGRPSVRTVELRDAGGALRVGENADRVQDWLL